jgi:hypothetical protein
MQRLFASIAFSFAVALASAQTGQHEEFVPTDNAEMRANAEKHTRMVDEVTTLNAEQREKVNEAYMMYERELKAIEYRFSLSGHTPEEVASERRAQLDAMEILLNQRFKLVMTSSQFAKWEEVSK